MSISWSEQPVCNKCGCHLVLNGGVCECDLRQRQKQVGNVMVLNNSEDLLPLPVINFSQEREAREHYQPVVDENMLELPVINFAAERRGRDKKPTVTANAASRDDILPLPEMRF